MFVINVRLLSGGNYFSTGAWVLAGILVFIVVEMMFPKSEEEEIKLKVETKYSCVKTQNNNVKMNGVSKCNFSNSFCPTDIEGLSLCSGRRSCVKIEEKEPSQNPLAGKHVSNINTFVFYQHLQKMM